MSQALVHFVTARASMLTDHRISGLLMRAEESNTFDKSPTVFQFFSLELLIIDTRCGHSIQLLDVFVRQFAVPFNAFPCVSRHVAGQRYHSSVLPESGNCSAAPAEIRDSSIFLYSSTRLFGLHSR